MSIPEEAVTLENRFRGKHGEPVLGNVYRMLKDHWRAGNLDRELGLHLMFVARYCCCEPPHLTGINTGLESELSVTFNEVHDYFVPSIEDDAEMLYVVGLMAHLFPYYLGDENNWLQISETYRARYRTLLPNGIAPNLFFDRGVFGKYF